MCLGGGTGVGKGRICRVPLSLCLGDAAAVIKVEPIKSISLIPFPCV